LDSGVTPAFRNAWLGGGEKSAGLPALDCIVETADPRFWLLDKHAHILANERLANLLGLDHVQ
jgi:hypothetical protein